MSETPMNSARPHFHRRLASLQRAAVAIGREVQRSVADATDAWLRRDATAGAAVDARTMAWSARARDVEQSAYELIATQQPMASDLRQLTALVRITEAVSRSGELVAHVARSACFERDPDDFTARVRALVVEMATMAAMLYGNALTAYEDADGAAGRAVADDDLELDALRNELIAALVEEDCDVVPAVDLALLGRFYERVGDHAVDIGRLADFIANGRLPPTAVSST